MKQTKKCILINSGRATREAFVAGLKSMSVEYYYSKQMILHIDSTGTEHFIYKNTPINFEDSLVFLRLRGTDPHFCGMLCTYLRHNHIPVNDTINASFSHSAGKIAQMLFLSLAKIHIPETIIFREESYHDNRTYISTHISFPLIYKTDGSKGKNVFIAHSREELDSFVLKKKIGQLAMVQTFIPNDFDIRVLVAYGETLGSMKRTRSQGYLNNIAQGATASKTVLSNHEYDIATQATTACHIDIGGVDMIQTESGPVVLEVNKSPQIKGFESVHDFKVFTKIAEIIQKKFVD